MKSINVPVISDKSFRDIAKEMSLDVLIKMQNLMKGCPVFITLDSSPANYLVSSVPSN